MTILLAEMSHHLETVRSFTTVETTHFTNLKEIYLELQTGVTQLTPLIFQLLLVTRLGMARDRAITPLNLILRIASLIRALLVQMMS